MNTKNKEQEATDAENEKQYKKSLKEEKAVTGSAKPELKVVESGVTDGQGNFVAFVDGEIPADRKKEVSDWKHKYKTLEDDSIIID